MINSNLVVIKIGQFNDPNFAEYVLDTQLDREHIIDHNNNLTPEFLLWLKEYNYRDVIDCYYDNNNQFMIDFYYGGNLDEIAF